MEQTVYNPQKGRLETIDIVLTKENTTWFDDRNKSEEVYTITDYRGGLELAAAATNIQFLFMIYQGPRLNMTPKKCWH